LPTIYSISEKQEPHTKQLENITEDA